MRQGNSLYKKMLPGLHKDIMIPSEWPYECRSKQRAKLFCRNRPFNSRPNES